MLFYVCDRCWVNHWYVQMVRKTLIYRGGYIRSCQQDWREKKNERNERNEKRWKNQDGHWNDDHDHGKNQDENSSTSNDRIDVSHSDIGANPPAAATFKILWNHPQNFISSQPAGIDNSARWLFFFGFFIKLKKEKIENRYKKPY